MTIQTNFVEQYQPVIQSVITTTTQYKMMSAPPTTQYKMMGAPPTTTNLLIIEQKRVVAELVFERSLILSDLEKVEKHYRPVTYSLAVVLLSQKGIVEKEITAARQVLKKLKRDDGGIS